MIQLFKDSKYDFIRWRIHAIIFSIAVIVIGLGAAIVRGGLNFSIDFVGGTLMLIKFEKPVQQDIATVRSVIAKLDFGSPEVKRSGPVTNNELQITVRQKSDDDNVPNAIKSALQSNFPDNKFEIRKVEHVGPKIGSELKRNAIIASILSLIAILIYVGIRFHLPFGVASIIPLFHDGLFTLALFVLLDREISLTFIAAILTILGYSINDTIVIFDRIRENIKGGLRGKNFIDIINASINQTLSRTIITSLTTLFVVATLFILGSEAIKDFALALFVGFTVGAYSTIYIASPVLIWWHKKWPVIK